MCPANDTIKIPKKCGNIPENILDPIVCGEYGHCYPCDFRDMEVLPMDKGLSKPVTLVNA